MRKEEYFTWLLARFDESTARSRLSNCKRIENHKYDLDLEYKRDGGKSLIKKLTYTKKDEEHRRPTLHNIPIDGNQYTGTQTLKQAAKLYIKFSSGADPRQGKTPAQGVGTPQPQNPQDHGGVRAPRQQTTWPDWSTPSDDELFETIKLLARYTKFLKPEIIELLVEDNKQHHMEWSAKLTTRGINPLIYLWDGSPCAFPGVRRYSGSKEIASYRGHTTLDNAWRNEAVKLDDNDFPKHIWAFLFTGHEFRKRGPTGYQIAHIVDHKKNSTRHEIEFNIVAGTDRHPPFGLFTAPTNTAYVPQSLICPTDFSPIFRRILFQHAQKLYGEICNILPPWLSPQDHPEEKYHEGEFSWCAPVGESQFMQNFLEFRKSKIDSLFLQG